MARWKNPQGNYTLKPLISCTWPWLLSSFLRHIQIQKGFCTHAQKATVSPQGPQHRLPLMTLYATFIQDLQGNQEPKLEEQQHFFEQ